ncbi:MAG: cytochrome c5 family protein [Tatlockia sp.]|nr:cytochrome c5 family protein [Tatlockia sp.]
MVLKFVFILNFCLLALTISHASSHHPQEFLRSIEGSKDEGEQIVAHFCSSCHAAKPIIQLGAPKINVKSDWEPRIKQGLATLLTHTEEGLNAMPPRGGCFECNDKQLYLAILAMLPEALRALTLSEIKDHK